MVSPKKLNIRWIKESVGENLFPFKARKTIFKLAPRFTPKIKNSPVLTSIISALARERTSTEEALALCIMKVNKAATKIANGSLKFRELYITRE